MHFGAAGGGGGGCNSGAAVAAASAAKDGSPFMLQDLITAIIAVNQL
jgi:hypothetical protein